MKVNLPLFCQGIADQRVESGSPENRGRGVLNQTSLKNILKY